MNHITVGIFGNTELAKKLAKSGTTNDIAILNHASSEGVLTFAHPNSEKLQPLLQVIGMVDFPVLVLSQITKEIGEQIVALDAAGFPQGYIVADGIAEAEIKKIVKGSSLEKFPVISNDIAEIRQAILQTKIDRNLEAATWLPIDNYFNVKGVGTVALSIMKQGRVKKHDALRIEPLGKEATIKGIQSQDRDIAEAEAGMRLGLNLKGIEADELKRGYVICKEAKVAKEILATFAKSKYSKEEIAKGSQIFITAGLQVIAASVVDVKEGKIHLKLEQPLAYRQGDKCIFASTKPSLPRILGNGTL
jgi:selenocysteine-specific translation elongation factor